MDVLWIILAVAGGIAAVSFLLDAWAWWNPRADAVHFAPTSDGWEIAIHELKPGAGGEGSLRPVILCHGIVMSRRCWLPHPGVPSIARELQRRGHSLWIVELRGSGRSRPGKDVVGKWDYPFTDYADFDVPAIVDTVRKLSGSASVDWVGHSLGGMVGYTHLSRHGAGHIEKMVTLGSPVNLGRKDNRLFVPRFVSRLLRPFSSVNFGLFTLGIPFLMLNAPLPWVAPFINLRKIRRRFGLGIFTWGIQRTGMRMLSEFNDWFQAGGPWLPRVAASEGPFPVPPGGLLALHGRNDFLVPPGNVKTLSRWFPKAQVEPADDGNGRGFGHLDMLAGPAEVGQLAERIDRFLRAEARVEVASGL